MWFFRKHKTPDRNRSTHSNQTTRQATLARLRPLRCEPLEDRRMLSITLFVDDDAASGGDGLGWGTAYSDLQSALTQAAALNADADTTNDVDQIWIAEGTYYPTAELEPGDARSASFSLINGVSLYGGFDGTEMMLAERDLLAGHTTTLSGDLGVVDDNSDNVYTVVYCGDSIEALIDGLSITKGMSNNNYYYLHRSCGGGFYNSGTLEIRNAVIVDNSAMDKYGKGGGIYNDSGIVTIIDTTISHNTAFNSGGGIYNDSGEVNIIRSTISDNSASSLSGGGIKSTGSMTIADSSFFNNSAISRWGGAIVSDGTATIAGSTIINNNASSGAGVSNSGIMTITNSTISNNSAEGDTFSFGGGICNWPTGTLAVMNSSIIGNSCTGAYGGGGIMNHGGVVDVINSIFSGNSATKSGGGIYSSSNTLFITNSTISENVSNRGGGIYLLTGSASISNTIIAENDAIDYPDICQWTSELTGSNNLVGKNSHSLDFDSSNQIGTSSDPIDPLLSDLIQFDNGLWGYALLPNSPAIDAGENTLAVDEFDQPLVNDFEGKSRFIDGSVDVGAYEYDRFIAKTGGPYLVDEGSVVLLDASTTFDPFGEIVSYQWDFDDDGQYDNSGGKIASFSSTDSGNYTIWLKVSTADGEFDTRSTTIKVTNVVPIANVSGPCVTQEGSVILLDASDSVDSGQDIVSYEWDFDNDGQYDDANGAIVNFSSLHDGTYTINLKVTDKDGAYDSASITVMVENVVPVADVGGPYVIGEGSTLLLDASGSFDPGQDIVSYEWDLDNDGLYDDATGVSANFNSLEDGNYQIAVRVTDSNGAWGTDSVTFTVENVAPTADAGGPYVIDEGNSITLTASNSFDPGNDIVLFEWDFNNDGQYDDAIGEIVIFDQFDSGVYTINLRVTDDDGSCGINSTQVIVENVAPTADAGEDCQIDEGSTVLLDASGSFDPGNDIVSYEWEFNRDGYFNDASGIRVNFSSLEDGERIIYLKVTDADGSYAIDTIIITVNNVAPTANAGGPYVVAENLPITLSAADSYDPGNDIVSYNWDLDGDGEYDDAVGKTTDFISPQRGEFTVGLKVTDNDGAWNTTSTIVAVSNIAPTADAGGPYSAADGETITLTAEGSFDPGDDIISYEWDLDGDGEFDDATGVTVSFSRTETAGTYTVAVKVTDDEDAFGTAAATVTVTPILPTVSFLPAETVVDANGFLFSVTYSDNAAVLVATIGNGDLLVTGPNDYSQTATLVSVDDNTDGKTRMATYRVLASGDGWAVSDNGSYQISMVADQVSDIYGNYVPMETLGTLTLTLPETENDTVIIMEDWDALVITSNDLLNNDSGHQTMCIDSVTATADTHGQVELINQTVLYRPDASFDGAASFEYTVIDKWGFQSTATVTVSYPLTIVVDSLLDVVAEDGVITLREAIEAACTNTAVGDAPAGWASVDRIVFDPSLYADGPATIILDGVSLSITGDTIEIRGPGAELLSIDANGQSSVFDIATTATATIDALSVCGGFGSLGGGILNRGKLIVNNATISDNFATASDSTASNTIYNSGGGVFNSGTLSIINSKLLRNTATNGGGIYNLQAMVVTNSTIAYNSATSGGASCGGGIYNSMKDLRVINSSISNNSVTSSSYSAGGGIYTNGKLDLISSTMSGNSATSNGRSYGGGICNALWHYGFGESGILNLINSTLSGNSAMADEYSYGGGICNSNNLTVTNTTLAENSSGFGGGIYSSNSYNTSVTLNNTVVAGNQALDSYVDIRILGNYISGSHNFIGDGSGQSTLVHGVDGNLVGTSDSPIDPMLGPLQDNGGTTFTHDPLAGSPLIDAGSNALAVNTEDDDELLLTDQRGFLRRFGIVDIGAVESQPFGVPVAYGEGFSLSQNSSLVLTASDLLENDFCNDESPLTVQICTSPVHGVLIANSNGTFTYTPEEDFWGSDVFSYQAVNGAFKSNTVEVVVSIISPQSIVVTTVDDEQDGNLSWDDISLREALYDLGASQILFSSSLANKSIALNETLNIAGVYIKGLGSRLTIDGNQHCRVFNVGQGESTLSQLTITGGSAPYDIDYGGGIYNIGNLTVLDTIFRDNSAYKSGGAIYNGATLTVTNSTFTENVAGIGNYGSIFYGGGGIYNSGILSVTGSTFAGNTVEYGSGGGIYSQSGTAMVNDSTFTDNFCGAYGGGAGISNNGNLIVVNSNFSNNTATLKGSGVYNHNNGVMTLDNAAFIGNTVTESSDFFKERYGGTVYNYYGTMRVVNSLVENNTAGLTSGGIYNNRGKLTLVNSIIARNSGVGIYNYGDASVTELAVSNSTIVDNATYGISSVKSSTSGTAAMVLINNTIVAQNNQTSAPDINGPFSGSHNLIGIGSSQSSLIDGVDGNRVGTFNAPIDPWLDEDGSLLPGSPAIDAGNNSLIPSGIITEFVGNYRIANGTVDIGAYEFGSTPLLAGDANCDGKVDGSDVTILAGNWQAGVSGGQAATWTMGDFNGDGKVDGSDVTILAGNWQAGVRLNVVAVSEPKEETTRFVPPASVSLGVATVPRRESLPARRFIKPISESTDAVLTEAAWSENDYTAVAKDLVAVSAKKSIAASDELFTMELDPYADFD